MENLYKDLIKPTDVFYGQWNPPEDQVAYLNYFYGIRNGFCIEAGAGYYGLATKFFVETMGWEGLYIEPSKYSYRVLKENTKELTAYWCGLNNKSGTAMFTDIVSAPGGGNDNGAIHHSPYHKKELDGYGCVYETYSIPTITYKELIKTFNVKKVDYMSLDVEGNELNVLEGMKGCKVLPDVLCIEYPYVGLNNLKDLCKSLGYTFNFVSFNNAFFSNVTSQPIYETWYGSTEPMKDLL